MAPRFTLPARRVAVVTGAARGIGRSIALRLARDGHDVAVADLRGSALDTVAKEIEAIGRRALALHADVSREEDVHKLVNDVAGGLGSVDIVSSHPLNAWPTDYFQMQMVANAGIVRHDTVLSGECSEHALSVALLIVNV